MKQNHFRALILIPLLLCFASCAFAQRDDFGGATGSAYSCPITQPDRINGSWTPTGTSWVFTPATGTTISAVNYPNTSTPYSGTGWGTWQVSVTSGPTFYIGEGTEPFASGGTAGVADWAYSGTDAHNNALVLSAVTTGSPGSLTFTSPVSVTHAAVNGWLEPLRPYDRNASGVRIVTQTAYGPSAWPCDPEGNPIFADVLSAADDGLSTGMGGHIGYTVSAASWASGVATLTLSGISNLAIGDQVDVSNISPSGYNSGTVNGGPQITSINVAAKQITYALASNPGTFVSCVPSGGTKCVDSTGWKTKFGDSSTTCNSIQALTSRWLSEGFLGVGEDGSEHFDPQNTSQTSCVWTQTPKALWSPWNSSTMAPSNDILIDNGSYVSQPALEISHATTASVQSGALQYGKATPIADYFNTNFGQLFMLKSGSGNSQDVYFSYPGAMSVLIDDSDGVGCTKGAQYFDGGNSSLTGTAGINMWNCGFVELVTSPLQYGVACAQVTAFGACSAGSQSLLPNPENYGKTLSATAPAGCFRPTAGTEPISGKPVGPIYVPCSMPDWLRNEYGTIAALNTAWNTSNFYTSFGTTGTLNTQQETTGTSFSPTLTGPVSPNSVEITVTPSGGSAIEIAFDCPNFENGCGGSSGGGNFLGPQAWKASAYYYQGMVTLDSNGNIEVDITAGRQQANSSAPTWPTTANCTGSETGTDTVVDKNVTWACVSPSVTGGTLTYSTGAVSALTINGAMPSGETLTISYTTGGWNAGGTGIEDEDGSHSWIGTVAQCVVPVPVWTSGMTYVAYKTEVADASPAHAWWIAEGNGTAGASAPSLNNANPGATVTDNGVPLRSIGKPVCDATNGIYKTNITTNANLGQDLADWVGYGLVSEYLSQTKTAASIMFPGVLYAGGNFSLQAYNIPTWPSSLDAEDYFVDEAFTGMWPAWFGDAMQPDKFQFLTLHYHGPWFAEWFTYVNAQGGVATASESTNTVTVTPTTQPSISAGNTWVHLQDCAVGAYDGDYLVATVGSGNFTYTNPVSGLASVTDCQVSFYGVSGTGWNLPNSSACPAGIFQSCASSAFTRSTNWTLGVHASELTTKGADGLIHVAGDTWWEPQRNTGYDWGFTDGQGNNLDGLEDTIGPIACSYPLGAYTCGTTIAVPWLGWNVVNIPLGMVIGNNLAEQPNQGVATAVR